jgi:hypothetical protein
MDQGVVGEGVNKALFLRIAIEYGSRRLKVYGKANRQLGIYLFRG